MKRLEFLNHLRELSSKYEADAEWSRDKFNKGYFEGKAEALSLVLEAMTSESDFKELEIN